MPGSRCNLARNAARAASSPERKSEAGFDSLTRTGASQADSSLTCETTSRSILSWWCVMAFLFLRCLHRGPARNNPNYVFGLLLEDHLASSSAERRTNQLVAIAISLIPSDLEVLKEAFDGFVKADPVFKQLIALKIVLEVPGRETMPIGQSSFYCCLSETCGSAAFRAPVPLRSTPASRKPRLTIPGRPSWRAEPRFGRKPWQRDHERV